MLNKELKLNWIDIIESEFIEGNIPHNNLDEICEEETNEYFKEYPSQLGSEDDKSEFYMELYSRLEEVVKGGEFYD